MGTSIFSPVYATEIPVRAADCSSVGDHTFPPFLDLGRPRGMARFHTIISASSSSGLCMASRRVRMVCLPDNGKLMEPAVEPVEQSEGQPEG